MNRVTTILVFIFSISVCYHAQNSVSHQEVENMLNAAVSSPVQLKNLKQQSDHKVSPKDIERMLNASVSSSAQMNKMSEKNFSSSVNKDTSIKFQIASHNAANNNDLNAYEIANSWNGGALKMSHKKVESPQISIDLSLDQHKDLKTEICNGKTIGKTVMVKQTNEKYYCAGNSWKRF